MAILSKCRPSRERIAGLTRAYSAHRPLIQRGLMTGFVLHVLLAAYRGVAARPSPRRRGGAKLSDGKATRVAVDAAFYQRLRVILRIVIPGIRTKEALLLCMHSTLLVFRTAISLYINAYTIGLLRQLVRGQSFQFLLNIIRWLLVAVPATWTNSWLSYVQNKLTIAYRTRLTNEVLKQYFGEEAEGPEGKCYYKLSSLDDRIKVPDQMITYDIQRFSAHLAAIYANLAKPTLDVILYNYQLAQNVGAEGLVILTVLIQTSSALLRVLSPSFGTYTAQSAALAGNLRHGHSRLVEFAEEIAFFGGQETERELLEREYITLARHEEEVMNKRWWYACAEEGIIKWLWGSFGLVICAIPVFFKFPGAAHVDLGSLYSGFVTNRRLLLSSSDAVGRVMYSYKDLAELAGYTSRVFLILDALSDVRAGKFEKALTNGATTGENGAILRGRGQVFLSEDIQFENVPIVTPNGDVLLQSLTFSVKPGENLLIVGPNGSGKSSLFRILGGLWPVYGGVVRKPPASDFLLIPQRPYLSLGTFRDQVIYPHSEEQMRERGVSDTDLLAVLAVVQMDGMVEREGWDVTREWRETLSGGDQQKLAWARLFYHRPKYAILDEATSLVPPDVEGRMMEHATALGITLLTVSHRSSLWKYHSHILQYDGQGGYIFTKLDVEKHLALQEEKLDLEAKLMEVPKMKVRLAELRLLVDAQGGNMP
ncbi:ABC transporter transmembrane region 2-domain-containing protein [Pisolithus orientalis]|uniref:ABC transporter transmembrane region 2-domain-containing protein n=1 Tax=Pisolithus orientalis TaxID=936130 RepID=UPI0022259E21|nr:ABC transporter transmembrane region 2-domain-containing protein [Pisolithus orientalis]KAI6005118.1 ABC transporter transmembrane region 2-domain-containing protein [Pisolithus orientalis]